MHPDRLRDNNRADIQRLFDLRRGRELSCSPEALNVLMRNRWPDNVEQLLQVLHKVTATLR